MVRTAHPTVFFSRRREAGLPTPITLVGLAAMGAHSRTFSPQRHLLPAPQTLRHFRWKPVLFHISQSRFHIIGQALVFQLP